MCLLLVAAVVVLAGAVVVVLLVLLLLFVKHRTFYGIDIIYIYCKPIFHIYIHLILVFIGLGRYN